MDRRGSLNLPTMRLDPFARAFDEARAAATRGEVPVGAVVVRDRVILAAP